MSGANTESSTLITFRRLDNDAKARLWQVVDDHMPVMPEGVCPKCHVRKCTYWRAALQQLADRGALYSIRDAVIN